MVDPECRHRFRWRFSSKLHPRNLIHPGWKKYCSQHEKVLVEQRIFDPLLTPRTPSSSKMSVSFIDSPKTSISARTNYETKTNKENELGHSIEYDIEKIELGWVVSYQDRFQVNSACMCSNVLRVHLCFQRH